MNRFKDSYTNIKTASKHLANVAKIVTGSKKPTKRVNRLERLKLQTSELFNTVKRKTKAALNYKYDELSGKNEIELPAFVGAVVKHVKKYRVVYATYALGMLFILGVQFGLFMQAGFILSQLPSSTIAGLIILV